VIVDEMTGEEIDNGKAYKDHKEYKFGYCIPQNTCFFVYFENGAGIENGAGYDLRLDGESINSAVQLGTGKFIRDDSCESSPPSLSPVPTSSNSPSAYPTLNRCSKDELALNLQFKTDEKGYETSWILIDVDSSSPTFYSTIASGSSYENGEEYEYEWCLPNFCYLFQIDDSGSDGINSDIGFKLQLDSMTIGNGTDFGLSSTYVFGHGCS